MYAGRVVETGSSDQIFYHSAHPYTRGLLESIPPLDAPHNARLTYTPVSWSQRHLPSGFLPGLRRLVVQEEAGAAVAGLELPLRRGRLAADSHGVPASGAEGAAGARSVSSSRTP